MGVHPHSRKTIVVNFSVDQFQFDKNLLTKFVNETNYCLDKLNNRWIILLKNKMLDGDALSKIDSKENSTDTNINFSVNDIYFPEHS